MKTLVLILFSLFTISSIALNKTPINWKIVSSKFDSTLTEGKVSIRFLVTNADNNSPFKNVSLHLNTDSLLGKTNDAGQLTCMITAGNGRVCADTPKGNSLVRYHNFLSQHSYVIRINLNSKKQKPPTSIKPDRNDRPQALKKPVIYLYPTQKQQIDVLVEVKGEFTFTYPKYPKNGWSVLASPDGKIEYNNRTYNYLFWEGESKTINQADQTEGFIVGSDTVVEFLEQTLTTVGLSDTEQADFITFWAPILEQNKLNFIHFEFNEGYTKYISEMKITPKPDSEIRLFMTFKPVSSDFVTLQQNIPSYKREGFTVVEWGGAEIKRIDTAKN